MSTTKSEYICRALMDLQEGTIDDVIERTKEKYDVDVRPSLVKDVAQNLEDQFILYTVDVAPTTFMMRFPGDPATEGSPSVEDDHGLSQQAADYAEAVITGDDWPLNGVDLSNLAFKTTTRSKRRHGYASYDRGNFVTITVSERTFERGGWEATKENIRHELVHAWQYQTNEVDVGHRNSFRIWVDALDLSGRTAIHYTTNRDDYNYIYRCPECADWFGKHRLCKAIRQAAEGGSGGVGYRYCEACDVKLHLVRENGHGDEALPHQTYTDAEIKQFARGEDIGVEPIPFTEVNPTPT